MADNQAPAQAGNRAPAGVNRRNTAGPNRPAAATMQLNPERAPPLIAKWQKLLGKDLDSIEIEYKADSVTVSLYGKRGTSFFRGTQAEPESISIPEYRELKSAASAPDDAEKLRNFKDKFELRLNRAFPANGPASGSDADIRAFIEGLDFHQRRAMLMSNKQFKSAYPNGFVQA